MNQTVKNITISILILMLVTQSVAPALIWADEIIPTDTPVPTTVQDTPTTAPTPTDAPTITDTPTPTDTITPTPTEMTTVDPSPTDTPMPTEDPSITVPPSDVTPTPDDSVENATASAATNTADVENSSTTTSDTGSNSSSGSGNATTTTGDAVSQTSVENTVNAVAVNGKVVNQTINIFIPENGNINLSDPFVIAGNAILARPNDSVITVSATDVNNITYLSNDILSTANTGNNTANSGADAVINTGNAYSLISLINKVNFTIVNSEIHVVTINIFGTLNGNIVLPNSNATSTCTNCGVNLVADNQATVTNTVTAQATTGDNSITATESGSITTGDAESVINMLNLLNSVYQNTYGKVLYINLFGTWNGVFLGWDEFSPQQGGASMVFTDFGPTTICTINCLDGTATISNNAEVTNTITSTANTGNNSVLANNGTIHTGKALSAISLINFINSTFINSVGFFGFINIFGTLNGNIGGAKEFAALPTPAQEQAVNSESQETGGLLTLSQTNNTGPYVNPGDTVTFFVTVGNSGTGKVYNAKLQLYLLRNGTNMGGAAYELGDLPAGSSLKVTTGLVLAKNAVGGEYTARAVVTGNVGPDNAFVSANGDSRFEVSGNGFITTNTQPIVEQMTKHAPLPSVLSATYPSPKEEVDNLNLLFLLGASVTGYGTLRIARQKKQFKKVFAKRMTFTKRMRALKIFLL